MKQQIIKIGAVLMTMVVLLSTMSFTVHQRYCSGDLVDTTLFLNSDSCKIVVHNDCCEITEECCVHQQIVIDGQNELQSTTKVISLLKKQFFVLNSPKLFFEFFHIQPKRIIRNNEYVPPNLFVDRQVTHQVFII